MDYTPMTEEAAKEYKEKLLEFYKTVNMDPIIINQLKEFDTESLLCMAAKDAIWRLEEKIIQIKEEQKQH